MPSFSRSRLLALTPDRSAARRLAAACALVLLCCHAAIAADRATITVDAARAIGTLKPLRGVNGAPDVTFLDPKTVDRRASPTDITAAYRAARINLVRTHDSHGAADLDPATGPLPALRTPFGPAPSTRELDLNVIFPDPKADPSDPRSYSFGPTDKLVDGIKRSGAEVMFRLGRSGMTTAEPPTDLDRYGEVIRHVVLHYNQGWAGGRRDGIRYWEVWNEPDLGQIFWRGTPEQYFRLYGAAAKAVKAADPKALVGGPTIAVVNQPTPYREGFLAYVRDHRLPLDFFSWHWYSTDADDPYDFVRLGRQMRTMLDGYGLRRTESIVDEWNHELRSKAPQSPAEYAAFTASAIVYMQDGAIDQQALYRADHEFGPKGPTKVGQALVALGRMADTPIRLAVAGGDDQGLAVQAARSDDGRLVQVLISNYEIPAGKRAPRKGPDILHEGELFDLQLLPRRAVSYPANAGYDLRVPGLRPGADYEVERWRMTAGRDFALVDTARMKGADVALRADLPPPSIELIVIRRKGGRTRASRTN